MRKQKYPLIGFTERLRDCVLDKGITHKQLAERCCCERKKICSYVNGYTVPDSTTLGKICMTLNVSADYLLFGKK